MASLTKRTKKVVIEKEVSDGVSLHLSDVEAQLLLCTLGKVGGVGKNRNLLDGIYEVLVNKYGESIDNKFKNNFSGCITVSGG
jgi:hypothetical protein